MRTRQSENGGLRGLYSQMSPDQEQSDGSRSFPWEADIVQLLNPETIARPASNYSQGVVVDAHARRLIISGQIGVNPDGSLDGGLEAQMRRCWRNLFAILHAAGMVKQDLVKVTVYVTQPGVTATYREIRDEMLEGHAPAATYVVIRELATPELLVEIEGEAVSSA